MFGRSMMAGVAVVLACGAVSAGGTISVRDVADGVAAGRVVVVDVREKAEFVAGHVPGAINLPLSGFSAAALPKGEGKTVVVMCRSGNRSARAQAIAAAGGRGDVVDFSGSMNAWSAAGGAIATGE